MSRSGIRQREKKNKTDPHELPPWGRGAGVRSAGRDGNRPNGMAFSGPPAGGGGNKFFPLSGNGSVDLRDVMGGGGRAPRGAGTYFRVGLLRSRDQKRGSTNHRAGTAAAGKERRGELVRLSGRYNTTKKEMANEGRPSEGQYSKLAGDRRAPRTLRKFFASIEGGRVFFFLWGNGRGHGRKQKFPAARSGGDV